MEALGDPEGEEGQGEGERTDGDAVFDKPARQVQHPPGDRYAEQCSGDRQPQEVGGEGEGVERAGFGDHRDEGEEERHRRRVVDETLALDEPNQALGRADAAEDRDHRHWVGGRHYRGKQ